MRDWDIRIALCQRLHQEHAGDTDTLLVEEMGVCQGSARIDIAVVNGVLSGFEIKSPNDTLTRLPRQRDAYNKVFDYVTIATSAKYLTAIEQVIPSWWGLMQVTSSEEGLCLDLIKTPERNPDVDPYALVQLLWKEEALAILTDHGLAKGLISKPRQHAWNRLVEAIPMPELADLVRGRLKLREAWQNRLPSLQSAPTVPEPA